MKLLQALMIGLSLVSLAALGTAAKAEPLAGDYLSDEFIAVLKATRSPYQAWAKGFNDSTAQGMHVVPGETGTKVSANWNWHEGTVLFTLLPDGRRVNEYCEYGEDCDGPDFYEQDAPDHFRVRQQLAMIGYSFVGDVEAFIVRHALVGSYVDEQGKPFEFGADGVMRGMGIEAPFSLFNDHVFDSYDFFILEQTPKRAIGFLWENGVLTLYPVVPFPDDRPFWGLPDYSKPIVTLRPVSAAR